LKIIISLAKILFVISIFILVITSVIRFFATEPIVQDTLMDYSDVEQKTDFAKSQLQTTTIAMSEYLSNKTDLLDIRIQTSTGPLSLFSPKEILHMQDVKKILLSIYSLQLVSFFYALVYMTVILLVRKSKGLQDIFSNLLIAGLGGNIILIILGLLLYFSFDQYFIYFHELAFNNDYWILDPNKDFLIKLYPLKFWNLITVAFISSVLVINTIIYLASYTMKKILK
tara:strand:+ start:939 stop:1619 length:681 start_codon:yes stop_codon:yes gene_type:complete